MEEVIGNTITLFNESVRFMDDWWQILKGLNQPCLQFIHGSYAKWIGFIEFRKSGAR